MREPALDFPAYKSTALRHPKQPLIQVGPERTGPALAHLRPGELCNDLTKDGPVGERITLSGRLLDSAGRPIADSLIEIWQANSAGRYRHRDGRWPAPLDPQFPGRRADRH
jgi:protocatechuate 3,4-dioxygenase, beta subunit